MKYILTIFLLSGILPLFAQNPLMFEKRFVDCEDQWVALSHNEDSTYMYGFVYIDEEAGLTFSYEGFFKISNDQTFVPQKIKNTSIKYRIDPEDNRKLALIPASGYASLKIPPVPDWLKYYKETKDSVGRMVRWGYFYNGWNEPAKALTFLEPAYKLEPHYKGLEFELSYAYNALEQFDKSIPVLKAAIAHNNNECLLYKEITFAYTHLNKLVEASAYATSGIGKCSENDYKAELAYTLALQYFELKDKSNFAMWAAETKKWSVPGTRVSQMLASLEQDLEKQ